MRVVGIGGGHGLAATLRAARVYADSIAAVVTVADDGGSSGRLSRELGIPPPGDVRNCLVALAGDEGQAALWQHRFRSGALTGHSVGNLVIAGLTETTGDFAAAVARAGRMLGCRGKVHPATTQRVGLQARVKGGVIAGQVAVAKSAAAIEEVFLEPSNPGANPAAVEAIEGADQVVLGPGSLFTSLLATLIVPGVAGALGRTRAKRVFVCNTRMQKGETDGLDAAAHVDALRRHVGDVVDVVVVQDPVLDDGVPFERDRWATGDLVVADLAGNDGSHDPLRLAEVLRGIGPCRLRSPDAGLI